MTMSQEMFRFVATRRLDRAVLVQLASRLIRDRRETVRSSLLVKLFGPGEYEQQLPIASAFRASADFLRDDDPLVLAADPIVVFLRENLQRGVALPELFAEFAASFPAAAALLESAPAGNLLEQTNAIIARLWDSLYAQTIVGCNRYVSTNYLVDALRMYHVLGLLWMSRKLQLQAWAGASFDEYHTLIDLNAAAEAGGDRQLAPVPASRQSIAALAAPAGVFRVELSVGAMKPPTVGDLLLVEQELRGYELGELAEIESIMRGERRERTVRKLNRTSQTTLTESSFEREESSSLKTDERFQLSSQAQQTAAESFSVQMGLNVSGKFGPVQVAASVNASYDTSQSSTESSSQEYAKTVTEEASKRIKSSIKESSSVTILSETQDTALRGFNNEGGTTHINGLYRWVDKTYEAKLMNYGRRLMLSLNVPEPAAFYRALLQQSEQAEMTDLVEPLHPSRIGRSSLEPLTEGDIAGGFRSHQDLSENNYAELAALYDVSVQPPPADRLTGSKTIVYPEAMQAAEIKVHDAVNDLGYVGADNTITLDAGYRLTSVAVFAPEGAKGDFLSYANVLKLGEVAAPSAPEDGTTIAEANLILVQVADRTFYLSVRRDPDDGDKKLIDSTFNVWQDIDSIDDPFGELVRPSIPVTITAHFEGALALTVMYRAVRRQETYDAWKSSAYADIVKGYSAKKQAYEQALAVATAQGQSSVEAQTFQLREDQYRSIELTELKRGCVDLMSAGTAAGHTSIAVAEDGTPTIIHDPATGAQFNNWRSPLANGSVAEFFERAFEWDSTTYQFFPYYWGSKKRWAELAQASGADPIFEHFLRAGSASVVVPVRPGYERSVIFFLKTGWVWGGGYLSLFTSTDMLDVYADVECGRVFDPPLQIGDSWEVRLPTSMVMLQESSELPQFPPETAEENPGAEEEVTLDDSVPF